MKYKDKKNIEIIQFGTGDVGIGVLGDLVTQDFIGVNFFPIPITEIGKYMPEYDDKLDFEVNTYCKLVFTKASSVDVLIEQLQRVKESLLIKENLS